MHYLIYLSRGICLLCPYVVHAFGYIITKTYICRYIYKVIDRWLHCFNFDKIIHSLNLIHPFKSRRTSESVYDTLNREKISYNREAIPFLRILPFIESPSPLSWLAEIFELRKELTIWAAQKGRGIRETFSAFHNTLWRLVL